VWDRLDPQDATEEFLLIKEQAEAGYKVLEASEFAWPVADVVEAMISHRPYRAALSLDEAMQELQDGAGTRYDGAACAAATQLFRERGFTFSEERLEARASRLAPPRLWPARDSSAAGRAPQPEGVAE
jgi:hypothetical protein